VLDHGLGLGLTSVWIAVVLGAAVAAFRRPDMGIYVLIPLLPNQTLREKLHLMPYGDQAIDILLLGITIGVWLRYRDIVPRSALRRPLIAIFILTFATLWLGSVQNNLPLPLSFENIRFSDWKNYCRVLFLVFLTQRAIRTRTQMFVVVLVMCVGVALAEREFIQNSRDMTFDTFSYDKRNAGSMPEAGENGLAAFLAEASLFLVAFAISRDAFLRWILTAFGIFTAGCMVMVFSRGAYLAYPMAFIVLGVLRRRTLVIVTLAVLITAIIAGASFIPGAVIQRATMTHDQSGALEGSAAQRLVMWTLVMNLFYQYPLFGAGYDTVKFLVSYAGLANAHNYYVQLLGEMGLAGLLSFVWLLAAALVSSWKLHRRATDRTLQAIAAGSLSCLAAIIVLNFFGDRWSYVEITGYTAVMLGMVQRGLELVEGEISAEELDQAGLIPEEESSLVPVS